MQADFASILKIERPLRRITSRLPSWPALGPLGMCFRLYDSIPMWTFLDLAFRRRVREQKPHGPEDTSSCVHHDFFAAVLETPTFPGSLRGLLPDLPGPIRSQALNRIGSCGIVLRTNQVPARDQGSQALRAARARARSDFSGYPARFRCLPEEQIQPRRKQGEWPPTGSRQRYSS
jgi:hypothetical protein